jgi:hypothetical protein
VYPRRLSVSPSATAASSTRAASANRPSWRRCQVRPGQFWYCCEERRMQARLVLQHVWTLPTTTNLRLAAASVRAPSRNSSASSAAEPSARRRHSPSRRHQVMFQICSIGRRPAWLGRARARSVACRRAHARSRKSPGRSSLPPGQSRCRGKNRGRPRQQGYVSRTRLGRKRRLDTTFNIRS